MIFLRFFKVSGVATSTVPGFDIIIVLFISIGDIVSDPGLSSKSGGGSTECRPVLCCLDVAAPFSSLPRLLGFLPDGD